MLWTKRALRKLSADVRRLINGDDADIRDHREGAMAILRNDIHTLATQRNERLTTLERERDAMYDTLANLSHQIKTPLTALSMMADLLENAPPNKQAEFLSHIKTNVAQMEWLTAAMLKMAQLDAGVVPFAKESVPVGALIRQTLEPLAIMLELKRQTVHITNVHLKNAAEIDHKDDDREHDVEPLCEMSIECDPRWSAEALSNIIKNASEHSPEGGVIHIAYGRNPLNAWIKVTDSGTGIPRGQIAGLFKRFEGASGKEGYGIGLPLAMLIMRGQGGDIEVDGGGGTGASFTLKFYISD
ncbi:MAG: HAMP domain-containing histidine kinase [Defluviitaleaceae bacterium]|nr:HAMP domain-containing histidine kinase [Defluviitaleaceae bacterium]